MRILALLFSVLTSPVFAQSLPPTTLAIPTVSATDTELLQGKATSAPAATISGQLYLPAATGIFPAMIILHGSGGDGPSYDEWVRVFNKAGVAAVRVDQYAGRGLEEIFSDQGRLGEFQAVFDAYRALDVLAEHPSIDPERIGVIGFSRGGIGALYSALPRFEDLYGSNSAKFAVHLPFYPPCNFSLDGELETSGAPIRAFHGSADEWNPAKPCRDYLERLKASGADAIFHEYEGARHSFDNTSSPAYSANPAAQTSRACFRREENGVLINAETGTAFSWQDTCVQNGPPQQYQASAASAATTEVLEVLKQVFALQ